MAYWKSYTDSGFATTSDNGQLFSMPYDKQRSDTTLRVSFSAVIGMNSHFGCSEWYIKFNNNECTYPAPVVSLVNTQIDDHERTLILFPAVISGFCNRTGSGELRKGSVLISAHVRPCRAGSVQSDSHTGPPTNLGGSVQAPSSLVVEEYCGSRATAD